MAQPESVAAAGEEVMKVLRDGLARLQVCYSALLHAAPLCLSFRSEIVLDEAFECSLVKLVLSGMLYRQGQQMRTQGRHDAAFGIPLQVLCPFSDMVMVMYVGDAIHDREAAGQDRHQSGIKHCDSGNPGEGLEGCWRQVCLPAGHQGIHRRPL